MAQPNYKVELSPYVSQPEDATNLHHERLESESESFIEADPTKARIKYSYLTVEQEHQNQRENRIFWLELLSMFIFIYSATCSKENTGVDLHFFVGILIAIPICAKQTGANLNPAISFSMTFKKTNIKSSYLTLLWIYVKAQILAAVAAAFLSMILNDVYLTPLHPPSASPIIFPQDEQSSIFMAITKILLSEAIGVFVLIFFILYVTGPYSFIETSGGKFFFIAIFVYVGRRFAAMSGNQVNFALTIAQASIGIFECNFKGFQYLIVWLIGDIVGVLLATGLYNHVTEPTLEYMEIHKNSKLGFELKIDGINEKRAHEEYEMKEIIDRNGKQKERIDQF